MINFILEVEFSLGDEIKLSGWISDVIDSEGFSEGEISYFFCDDNKLYELNKRYLNHDTLTDIVSFDYGVGRQINGEIYISVDRVIENAENYGVSFFEELIRVMVHGVLHYCGYMDKSEDDIRIIREREDFHLGRYYRMK